MLYLNLTRQNALKQLEPDCTRLLAKIKTKSEVSKLSKMNLDSDERGKSIRCKKSMVSSTGHR